MDWWQLIDFHNPDDEFRVVRNLYIIVSLWEEQHWDRSAIPTRHYKIVASVGHNSLCHYIIFVEILRKLAVWLLVQILPVTQVYNSCSEWSQTTRCFITIAF